MASIRAALLLLLAASSLVSHAYSEPLNVTMMLTEKRVPIIRMPSLAPTILEVLKLENVRGDMPQNLTHRVPLKLSELMPKLPVIPTFTIPVFTPETTEAEIRSNVTVAVAALQVPLVESTMLPNYITGLKLKVVNEIGWLDSYLNDTSAQNRSCSIMPLQFIDQCVAFTVSMQRVKIQALQSSLNVLQQMQEQLNTDMATQMLAFNLASDKAINGNWLCNMGSELDKGIKDAASRSTSATYAAKATSALDKLRDFMAGRWEASPWWAMGDQGASLNGTVLVATCPIEL